MKYILLVHHPKDTFDAPKDPADVAAGRAYGAALHAAGVFVAGAGLESPQNARPSPGTVKVDMGWSGGR